MPRARASESSAKYAAGGGSFRTLSSVTPNAATRATAARASSGVATGMRSPSSRAATVAPVCVSMPRTALSQRAFSTIGPVISMRGPTSVPAATLSRHERTRSNFPPMSRTPVTPFATSRASPGRRAGRYRANAIGLEDHRAIRSHGPTFDIDDVDMRDRNLGRSARREHNKKRDAELGDRTHVSHSEGSSTYLVAFAASVKWNPVQSTHLLSLDTLV